MTRVRRDIESKAHISISHLPVLPAEDIIVLIHTELQRRPLLVEGITDHPEVAWPMVVLRVCEHGAVEVAKVLRRVVKELYTSTHTSVCLQAIHKYVHSEQKGPCCLTPG